MYQILGVNTMLTKTVYSYDSTTKEYRGEAVAHESPRRPGTYLIPAYATEVAPPVTGANEAAVFDEEAKTWLLQPDYRYLDYYSTVTQKQQFITEIGVEPDATWTTIPPTDADAVWNGQTWKLSIEILKSRKKAEIADARWRAETGGMQFNGFTIATDRESQALITAAVTSTLIDPTYTVKWKMANGWVDLDAQTIQIVGTVVRNHIQTCFNREAALTTAVEDITTTNVIEYEALLKTITWEVN